MTQRDLHMDTTPHHPLANWLALRPSGRAILTWWRNLSLPSIGINLPKRTDRPA